MKDLTSYALRSSVIPECSSTRNAENYRSHLPVSRDEHWHHQKLTIYLTSDSASHAVRLRNEGSNLCTQAAEKLCWPLFRRKHSNSLTPTQQQLPAGHRSGDLAKRTRIASKGPKKHVGKALGKFPGRWGRSGDSTNTAAKERHQMANVKCHLCGLILPSLRSDTGAA